MITSGSDPLKHFIICEKPTTSSAIRAENALTEAICLSDSKLGVLCDELEWFMNVLPSGQRGNCRFKSPPMQVLGMYLAQISVPDGEARCSFLSFPNPT